MRKFVMIIMAVALIALPTMAQQQEWKSTSTMQTSGSAYTPQVNAVGATGVSEMATTTSSSQNSGPRKAKRDFPTPGEGGSQSDQSPIGDAVLPLLLLACAYVAFRAFRRKTSAQA